MWLPQRLRMQSCIGPHLGLGSLIAALLGQDAAWRLALIQHLAVIYLPVSNQSLRTCGLVVVTDKLLHAAAQC